MLGAAVQLFAAHRDDDEEAASRVRAHVLFPLEPGEGSTPPPPGGDSTPPPPGDSTPPAPGGDGPSTPDIIVNVDSPPAGQIAGAGQPILLADDALAKPVVVAPNEDGGIGTGLLLAGGAAALAAGAVAGGVAGKVFGDKSKDTGIDTE